MDNEVNIKNERYSYIRAFACIAIIGIHTVYSSIGLFPDSVPKDSVWVYRMVLNNLMWAVPCFIMVTGALLLDQGKTITYKKLFGKYIGRILLAIVFWGLIYILFEVTVEQKETSGKVFLSDLYEIFAGTSWSHMWYLYCLIGLYLLLPFYKKAAEASTVKDLRYLLIVYLLFLSLMPILKIWNINSGFYIHIASIYPFWLFCGYGIKEGVLKKKVSIFWTLFILGTLSLVLLSYIRWNNNVASLETFFGYSSILVVMQAVGLFGILAYTDWKGIAFLRKLLLAIDANSFGIYLVHLMFIRGMLKRVGLNPFEHGAGWCILGLVFANLIISYIVVWIIKKIPLLKKVV